MVGRMHSVSQKSDRGENRMTEEERMREVERISRKTKESVKNSFGSAANHPNCQVQKQDTCKLRRNYGRSTPESKRNGGPLRTDRTHRIKKTHVTQIHESG